MPTKVVNIAKNTSYFTFALILQKVISFTYFAILASHLPPEQLGKYYFAISFTVVVGILLDLGLGNVLMREVVYTQHIIEVAGRQFDHLPEGCVINSSFTDKVTKIDTSEVTGFVVKQRDFTTGVGSCELSKPRCRVPSLSRIDKVHSGIAGSPSGVGHFSE